MKLGKIVGVVWADRKVKQLLGCRIMIVQPMSSDLSKVGDPLAVADPGNIAGPGDLVTFVTNTDAAQAFETAFAPVNAAVVELVDFID
jgi:ethanolamine utilization protein EutN